MKRLIKWLCKIKCRHNWQHKKVWGYCKHKREPILRFFSICSICSKSKRVSKYCTVCGNVLLRPLHKPEYRDTCSHSCCKEYYG